MLSKWTEGQEIDCRVEFWMFRPRNTGWRALVDFMSQSGAKMDAFEKWGRRFRHHYNVNHFKQMANCSEPGPRIVWSC